MNFRETTKKIINLALLASCAVATSSYTAQQFASASLDDDFSPTHDLDQQANRASEDTCRQYKLGGEIVTFSPDLIALSELFTTMAKDQEEGILEFSTGSYIETLGFTLNQIHELLQHIKDESLYLENTKIRKLFKIAELANFINCPTLLNAVITNLSKIAEKNFNRLTPKDKCCSLDDYLNYMIEKIECKKLLNENLEALICPKMQLKIDCIELNRSIKCGSCSLLLQSYDDSRKKHEISVAILYFLADQEARAERNALLFKSAVITTGAAALYKRAAIKDLSINLLASCQTLASWTLCKTAAIKDTCMNLLASCQDRASWTLGTISSSLSVAKDRLAESRVSSLARSASGVLFDKGNAAFDCVAHNPKKFGIIVGAGCIGAGLMYATRKEIKQMYRELSQNTFLGPLAAIGVATAFYLGAKNTSMMLYPKKS